MNGLKAKDTMLNFNVVDKQESEEDLKEGVDMVRMPVQEGEDSSIVLIGMSGYCGIWSSKEEEDARYVAKTWMRILEVTTEKGPALGGDMEKDVVRLSHGLDI